MIGKNAKYVYKMVHRAIQVVTILKIVEWIQNKNTERPAKKRKRERWSSGGTASIVHFI